MQHRNSLVLEAKEHFPFFLPSKKKKKKNPRFAKPFEFAFFEKLNPPLLLRRI